MTCIITVRIYGFARVNIADTCNNYFLESVGSVAYSWIALKIPVTLSPGINNVIFLFFQL